MATDLVCCDDYSQVRNLHGDMSRRGYELIAICFDSGHSDGLAASSVRRSHTAHDERATPRFRIMSLLGGGRDVGI